LLVDGFKLGGSELYVVNSMVLDLLAQLRNTGG
jgi:hypothetical protein